MEWQLQSEDSWKFGYKVRGVIRQAIAQVYFDPDSKDRRGGWIWCVLHGRGQGASGIAASLGAAIVAAETVMGVLE